MTSATGRGGRAALGQELIMDIVDAVGTTVVGQTVTLVDGLTGMAVFTVLRGTSALTGGNHRLGRGIGQAAPGVRIMTAVTVGYRIGSHMLLQPQGIGTHVAMAGLAVVAAATLEVGTGQVVMTGRGLGMAPAGAMKVHAKTTVVAIVMTIGTGRRRPGKLGQVR